MHVTTSPSSTGRRRPVQHAPALRLVDSRVPTPAPITPRSSLTAPSEALLERDSPDLGPQLWYAVFLSAFLMGLLMLGGLWIWLNVRIP